MKAFFFVIFVILSTISYAFSKGINTYESKENLNLFTSKKIRSYSSSTYSELTSSLSRRLLSSSAWFIVLDDDTSMYSLILEDSITTEEKCKTYLKYLCEKLIGKLPKGNFTDILERLCDLNKRNSYCEGLFTKTSTIGKDLLTKCNGIKGKLIYYYYLGEDLFLGEKNTKIEAEHCENYGTLCAVFQRICRDLIGDLCARFNGLCYKKYTKDNKNSILLKFIGEEIITNELARNNPKHNELENYSQCVDSLLDKCHCVTSFGPTMVESCFEIQDTCKHLAQSVIFTCQCFDYYIKEFLSEDLHITGYKKDIARNNCSLFGVCENYLLLHCRNQTTKNFCKSLIKECTKEIDPDMLFINNLSLGKCRPTFKDINLTLFFSNERENSVSLPYKNPYLTLLIIFGTSLIRRGSSLKEKCKKFLEYGCTTHEHVFPNLDAYCKSKRTDECDNLDKSINDTCINLNKTFENLGLTSANGVWTILWNSTANIITTPQCQMFMEECIYFEHVCSGIKSLCENVKALCYTLGVKRFHLNNFWKKLKEKLSPSDFRIFNQSHLPQSSDTSKLHQPILDICAEFGGTNEVLFRWCLHPTPNHPPPPASITSPGNLLDRLFHDFSARYGDLKRGLLYVSEPPTLTECASYVYECHSLSDIFKNITNCTMLEEACYSGHINYSKLKDSTLSKSA
ncbi:uncharacterized protein T551_03643 [Pneumocystis jirovecii RU7]|uniref:Uncharacterized protein n=1 Tax=Pneumocystis jirovecii (strain RU7) TaxID=1408657 RepID=A0A0W4ZCM4_PNEJ7|nr:uncharacterized protein T551_03643 [Pneumocystis jirovecii RU7]KTW26071.1 hypothetical protein T551_03643 [Pneumocystis jirovecii RU7]